MAGLKPEEWPQLLRVAMASEEWKALLGKEREEGSQLAEGSLDEEREMALTAPSSAQSLQAWPFLPVQSEHLEDTIGLMKKASLSAEPGLSGCLGLKTQGPSTTALLPSRSEPPSTRSPPRVGDPYPTGLIHQRGGAETRVVGPHAL